MAGIGYVQEDPVWAGDREISAVPNFGASPGFGGSARPPLSWGLPEYGKFVEKFLKKIFNILKQHSADENFGIEKLCSLAGLSKSSLNRHLQHLTSRSPNSLLKEFRLNHALKLLRAGENISNIAFINGFRSPSYFSKCFKQHFHLSPSEYLEQLKKNSL